MERALTLDVVRRFPRGPTVSARASWPLGRDPVTVLFGPSGSGKTTVLRALAGLDRPDAGAITFGEERWFDAAAGLHLPPQRRGVGLVFQGDALFPHLTVAANVGFGLRRLARAEREARVAELSDRLGISSLLHRHPAQLSGGERQRVAIARALFSRPKVLLADEPTGNLDSRSSAEILSIFQHLNESGKTVVMVTHEPDVAAHCRRIVRMRDGLVVGEQPRVVQEQ